MIIGPIIILFIGCKEEFPVVSLSEEKILVIEGGITNNPGPYSIRLSLTSPIEQPFKVQKIPYQGCKITILEKGGNSELLTESEPGVYQTASGGIQGQAGKEYGVSVITPEGKVYETGFERMEEAVDIDSVYAELIIREDLDYVYGLPGIQFYVDTEVPQDRETYFLWNLIETYKYEADYKFYALFYFGIFYYQSLDADSIAMITGLNYDTLYTCWGNEYVGDYYIGKTSNLAVSAISRQPLHFVSTASKKLSIRYSILLQQYSIGKEAYYFWKNIKEQITEENFLYTKQPYNVAGNLKNKNNPEELVFGYFTVASVTTKRIYINRPNTTFYFTKGFISTEPPKTQPIYIILSEDKMGYIHKDCVDCRTEGGTIKRPEFWIDY